MRKLSVDCEESVRGVLGKGPGNSECPGVQGVCPRGGPGECPEACPEVCPEGCQEAWVVERGGGGE